MSKPGVRCRCGHQVLGREVLRTEPFEKASGREVVYVKYRCRRCKMLGEAFIAPEEWDPSIFETPRDEMGAFERDRFADQKAISSGDVIAFHRALKKAASLSELARPERRKSEKKNEKSRRDERKCDERRSDDRPPQAPRPGA